MKKTPVTTIVAIGIGAALFFVLGRFVSIPSPVPNTNISIQYGLLAFMAVLFGPVAGLLIGFIGHALIDFSYGWGGKMPGRNKSSQRRYNPPHSGRCAKPLHLHYTGVRI